VPRTFESAIWVNGGSVVGFGLYVNIGTGVWVRRIVQLINNADWECSTYYSLNQNGTLSVQYTAISYGGGNIRFDTTNRLSTVDAFSYPAPSLNQLVYAMTTNTFISNLVGGGDVYSKYELLDWNGAFYYGPSFNGISK